MISNQFTLSFPLTGAMGEMAPVGAMAPGDAALTVEAAGVGAGSAALAVEAAFENREDGA